MIDRDLLERLYNSYGFDINKDYKNVYVFIYTKSRYPGVDIVPLENDFATLELSNNVKEKYSKLGYAVYHKPVSSNEEAEIELFKSFFSFDSSVERLKRKYNEFVKKQTRNLLGSPYQYVESPFDLQNEINDETSIFNVIGHKIASPKAELIIIEAAAGYGKTCTAYEILNKIANDSTYQTPIFTELSRNRGIKKFKYILLDEIDIEYPSLNSILVKKEIKNGRIPIIIDGFDELLEKVNIDSSIDDSFEEVETMLDTIGHLLENKAKVILTTRKTAIFTGEEFESWIKKWQKRFNVTRLSIKEPRLKDWLGEDKYALIKEKDIPMQYLANPVILSFLKNTLDELFVKLMDEPENLVEEYFQRMLEREKERQNLIMTVDKQLEVFRNVVRMLLEFDCTSEDKEFFKSMILDTNRKLLEYTRTLYGGDDRHTLETLVDSLATHALLDRKGRDQNQIGFINDFVLGTLIGQIIVEPHTAKIEKSYSAYMIELAVTAYRVQNKKNKIVLWSKIQDVLAKFQNELIFSFDIYLKEALVRNHLELTVYDLSFFSINFEKFTISSSAFLNCYFKNCFFEAESFQGVSFINCTFENCFVTDAEHIDGKNDVVIIKCTQINCSILIEEIILFDVDEASDALEFEKEILLKLWHISTQKGHHIVKLSRCFEKSKSKKVYPCLKNLEEKGLITISGIHVYFVTNKITKIKEILGLAHEL